MSFVVTPFAIVALVLYALCWPFVHGALVYEGMLGLRERPPRFSRLALVVLLTPVLMFVVQTGVGCLGGCAVPALGTGFGWLLSMGASLLGRTLAYAVLLQLSTSKALGLSIAVSGVAWITGGLLFALVVLVQQL